MEDDKTIYYMDARYKVVSIDDIASTTLKKQLKINIGDVLYFKLPIASPGGWDRVYASYPYIVNETNGLQKTNASLTVLSGMLRGYQMEKID